MIHKKTKNVEVDWTNQYDFKDSPRISSIELAWTLQVLESSSNVSLMFMIPDQKTTVKGTIENEDGDLEDVYFNIEIDGSNAETEANSGTKLFPSDIFPREVSLVVSSMEKVDNFTYNLTLESLKVSF